MKRLAGILLILMWVCGATPIRANIVKNLKAKMAEPYDTTRDQGYWKRALLHGKFNPNDTTVEYPKFLDFCLDVYRWGDHTFNSYDTTYVKSTGKNWKLMLKNNNSLDSYGGHFTQADIPLYFHSDLTSTFGGQISFMAVSLSYMFNLNDLIQGKKVNNKRFDFSFTCSRFAIDAYYSRNENKVDIERLGDFHGSLFKRNEYDGVKRESSGVRAYYFFNNKKYAQAAAYCFSKYQLKSAGSFLAGIHYGRHDISMDFSRLDPEILSKFPSEQLAYHFGYSDYGLLFGYGHNWVLGKHWLINATMAPSLGFRKTARNVIEGQKNMPAFNYRGKLSVVLNRNKFFYSLNVFSDGTWFVTKAYSLFCANHDINVVAGFRF